MAFMARFAFTTRTRTTPRPTSRGPLPLIFILIVNGLTDYNTRRCGAPAGSKRRKKRLSSVIFHGLWPFPWRERSQLLPRLPLSVVRLHSPTKVSWRVARGCSVPIYGAFLPACGLSESVQLYPSYIPVPSLLDVVRRFFRSKL